MESLKSRKGDNKVFEIDSVLFFADTFMLKVYKENLEIFVAMKKPI